MNTTINSTTSTTTTTPTSSKHNPTTKKYVKWAWVLGGVLSIFVPILARNVRMNRYQNKAWENAVQKYNQYRQQAEQNEQQQNEQYQEQQMEQYRFRDLKNCKWYQFGCTPYYVDQDGNHISEYAFRQKLSEEEYRQQYNQQYDNRKNRQLEQNMNANQEADEQPDWYNNYWSQSEEERTQALQEGQTTGRLRFVYAWQLIMFLTILAYGYKVIHYNQSTAALIGALVVWFQFNFLAMFLLADGSIMTEDNIIQMTGFYGQFAVLMFMTNAWYAVFGLIFALYFFIRAVQDDLNEPLLLDHEDERTASNYKPMEAPTANASQANALGGNDDEYVKVV